MASYQQLSEQELADLQKASNEYEPEAEGPLVGPREPCTKITTEYANADPVFQAKTAALPQKYSHYRTVRGDGRCGWRAIAFGYFEALIHLGDGNKFVEEETRLRSLKNVLSAAGFDPLVYEDFADETFFLLRRLSEALAAGNADDILIENFNDEMIQNYIVTHLKTLTSAWMRTRPSEYAPWLLGQTVEQYCDTQVMPITAEIENVSLSALKDVLLSPAGVALEVLYLDRTEGDEANMHRFDPVNPHGGMTIGTIRLLYRPGHYDILYKTEDFPQSVTAYLQFANPSHDEHVQDIGTWDFMAAIPGGSLVHNAHHAWMSGSTYSSPYSDLFATPPTLQQCVQPIASAAPTPMTISQTPVQAQPTYVPTTTSAHLVAPPNELSRELPLRGAPTVSFVQSGFQNQLAGPFRPSAWQLEDGFMQAAAQVPNFQTSIFRNSHFNTAHFLNPDFQPEEWKPDDEYVTTDSKRARHKITG